MGEFYQDNYAKEHARPQAKARPLLWPWVVSGLILALGLVAYCEPIPSHTTAQPVSLGPNSPLYGPMQGGTAIPLAPGQ